MEKMLDGLSGELISALHRFKRMPMGSLSDKLSRGEFFVLNMIHKGAEKNPERGGIYVSEIAEHLKMAPSGVSRMLKALTEKGLVERKIDESDRRNTYVFLTEQGESIRSEMAQMMGDMTKRVIDHMGEEDTQELIRLTNKLADLVEAEINDLRNRQSNQ